MELAIAYALEGPDGTRAVVGNGPAAEADPDWVGYLDPDNGITGLLDGSDHRTSEQAFVMGDGGEQGPTFLGLRPGTVQGIIAPNVTKTLQEEYGAKLKRASRALRADGLLRWTPSVGPGAGIERYLRFRRTARPDIGRGRPPGFQLSLSSPMAYVLSVAEQSVEIVPGAAAGEVGIPDPIPDPIASELNVTAQQYAQNLGDSETWPRLRIEGPITNPQILNQTTGERISLVYTLGAGEFLDVYPERGVVLLGGQADRYSSVDFDATVWWRLESGQNDIRLLAASYGAGARVFVYWRHAWE